MANKSFIDIYACLLADISSFCKKEIKATPADNFTNFFLLRLEAISDALSSQIRGLKISFGHDDLPFLLYIAWLVVCLRKKVKNKKNSKKTVSLSILNAICEAHKAQHQTWNDPNWLKNSCPINSLTDELICGIYAREYREAFFKSQDHNPYSERLFALYTVCIEFLSGKEKYNFADIAGKLPSTDPYDLYVTEWPKRTCPVCSRHSYPIIAQEKAFDVENGFYLKCQYCGTIYGKGGKKKSLYKDGKRITSTVWTTDKFEINSCQICGLPANELADGKHGFEAHHIIPLSEGGPDIPSNIMILCPSCHAEAHRRRENRKS